MASKQNRKVKKRTKGVSKQLSARFDSFSSGLSEMLMEDGVEEKVRFSDLSKASMIESFIEEWSERIVEIIDVAATYTDAHRSPCGRMILFMQIPRLQNGWSYVDIDALDIRSTVDFAEMQDRMDEALDEMPFPGLAVWVHPSPARMRMHTLYIRCDAENHLVLVTSDEPKKPIQRIVGPKKVELIGDLIYRDHVGDISPWMRLIDDYADDFLENGLSALNETMLELGLSKPLEGDSWDTFAKVMFRNVPFLQLLMSAGRQHARRPLMEAQGLAGAIMIERSEHALEIEDLKKGFDADRERAKGRVLQEKEREEVLKKGVRDLVARQQAENASLRSQLQAVDHGTGENSTRTASLHKGFKSVFAQVLGEQKAAS